VAFGDNFAPVPIANESKFDFWKRCFATNNAWEDALLDSMCSEAGPFLTLPRF
jgi:hypothetical protein